ncbi:UNVERIFIED_CONTAM: hypothetical protein FKN15_048678 [Acipenser sinensis]
MSSVGSISEEETCEKLKGLIQRQVQICKRNVEVMDSVRRGAQLAIDECQYQFRNRRWNCSTLDTLPVFGKVVTQGLSVAGTREAAFVYAISSAGVAFAVTRACSSGELEKCGCDRTVHGVSPEGFQWSGCSDNIAYGVAFSQSFVDVRERSKGSSGPIGYDIANQARKSRYGQLWKHPFLGPGTDTSTCRVHFQRVVMEPACRKDKQKQKETPNRGDNGKAKHKSAQQELKQRQRAESTCRVHFQRVVMEPACRKDKQKQKETPNRGDNGKAKHKSAQQELKQRQRAEIYALNKVMTELEQQQFEAFCKQMQSQGE